MYLFAGINDWGGVSPVTQDFINPERPWPQIDELRRTTESAGFQLRERLPLYPEYVRLDGGFIPDRMRERVRALAGADGLVRGEEERW
jgi:FO synthase